MTHVKDAPMAFIGILLLIVGWFAVFSGIFGFFRAEDLLVFTLKLESMILNTTFVPQEQIFLHLGVRIFLGFVIILIGNSFLIRGLNEHRIMHPRLGDFSPRRLA